MEKTIEVKVINPPKEKPLKLRFLRRVCLGRTPGDGCDLVADRGEIYDLNAVAAAGILVGSSAGSAVEFAKKLLEDPPRAELCDESDRERLYPRGGRTKVR